MRNQRKTAAQLAMMDKRLASAEAYLARDVNAEGSPISPVSQAGRKEW
jgi:hypothetical protein